MNGTSRVWQAQWEMHVSARNWTKFNHRIFEIFICSGLVWLYYIGKISGRLQSKWTCMLSHCTCVCANVKIERIPNEHNGYEKISVHWINGKYAVADTIEIATQNEREKENWNFTGAFELNGKMLWLHQQLYAIHTTPDSVSLIIFGVRITRFCFVAPFCVLYIYSLQL